jgi:putative radical SAM enzyme (TIGR03279 family)
MKENKHVIHSVAPGSIAEELELQPGDTLLSINGKKIEDVFDYHYLVNDEYLEVIIEKTNGEEWDLEIEKDYEEDLGIEFESGLMDEYRSCTNKCMFCFIDQMPKGMRETLYFKDDDSRLSFLQGNYVTLTNMSDHDIERIIEYKLSPINVSIHTTNPELRVKMLHNRFAGEALKKIDRLYDAGIVMNGQIVLCKGVNDGEELERTIKDIERYIPYLQSVSIVPVGLTKYREGLYELEPFTKEDAEEVLALISKYQEKFYKKYGTHMVQAGDEWYILADKEFPCAENYDGYLQLENGVGMMRLLNDEIEEALEELTGDNREVFISMATGVLAFDFIKSHIESIHKKFPNVTVHLYKIINYYFGEHITVAGLLTGIDLINQLKDRELGERLLLSSNVLRSNEDVFLDDITVQEMEKALQVKVDIVKSSGTDFVKAVLG